MSLIPVEDALRRLLDGAGPLEAETLPIAQCGGRILATPLHALRTQPPFDASAMDGYAVRAGDLETLPARLKIVGSAPAGRPFEGRVGQGEAVRIFTGAPVPAGADGVLIQENARAGADGTVEAGAPVPHGAHIRRAGLDFSEGERLMEAGHLLDAAALSLAASANHARLSVVRRPLVAILATGDELLPPGSAPGPGQIIASNSYGIAALAADCGAEIIDLGIAADERGAIAAAIGRAKAAGADVVVTLGGASVGDHDLMREALLAEGAEIAFWKIAMRPGKPLMAGRLADRHVLGLPGNPVASIVCAHVFLKPLLAALGGRRFAPDLGEAVLGAPLPANDQRQDYLRATLRREDGGLVAMPAAVQDSSMLRVLAASHALIIRPPFAPAAKAGEPCRLLMLR